MLTELEKSSIPGRMDSFRITELSGVRRPAQKGAIVSFIKSSDGDDDTLDGAIKAMMARGEAITKSAQGATPQRAGPGDEIAWGRTARAHVDDFATMAKARAKADGCTFEQAYAKGLGENPHAARRAIAG